jgi:hypothetical protein
VDSPLVYSNQNVVHGYVTSDNDECVDVTKTLSLNCFVVLRISCSLKERSNEHE